MESLIDGKHSPCKSIIYLYGVNVGTQVIRAESGLSSLYTSLDSKYRLLAIHYAHNKRVNSTTFIILIWWPVLYQIET